MKKRTLLALNRETLRRLVAASSPSTEPALTPDPSGSNVPSCASLCWFNCPAGPFTPNTIDSYDYCPVNKGGGGGW